MGALPGAAGVAVGIGFLVPLAGPAAGFATFSPGGPGLDRAVVLALRLAGAALLAAGRRLAFYARSLELSDAEGDVGSSGGRADGPTA